MDPVDKMATSQDEERDNLESIEGIGPTYAAGLRTIGITRFAHLAQHTAGELAKALREKAGV